MVCTGRHCAQLLDAHPSLRLVSSSTQLLVFTKAALASQHAPDPDCSDEATQQGPVNSAGREAFTIVTIICKDTKLQCISNCRITNSGKLLQRQADWVLCWCNSEPSTRRAGGQGSKSPTSPAAPQQGLVTTKAHF